MLQCWCLTCHCVHTLTPRGNRDRSESGIYLKIFEKTQYLMNTLYLLVINISLSTIDGHQLCPLSDNNQRQESLQHPVHKNSQYFQLSMQLKETLYLCNFFSVKKTRDSSKLSSSSLSCFNFTPYYASCDLEQKTVKSSDMRVCIIQGVN